jgi:hypothetical protein
VRCLRLLRRNQASQRLAQILSLLRQRWTPNARVCLEMACRTMDSIGVRIQPATSKPLTSLTKVRKRFSAAWWICDTRPLVRPSTRAVSSKGTCW